MLSLQFNLPMMVAGFLGLVLTAATLSFSSNRILQIFFSDRAQSNKSDRAQSNTITLTFSTKTRRLFGSARSNLFVWAQSNLRVGAGYSVYYVATHGFVMFHILSTFSNSFIIEEHHLHFVGTQICTFALALQVIHEHNQQQQQEEEDSDDSDTPLPSSTSTLSSPRYLPSFSPVLFGLLTSTAVLRIIWGNLRVPMGVDATTLLPVDAQLGMLLTCSMIGALLRSLLVHYTTDFTAPTDLTIRNSSLDGMATRPIRHYLSLFALLLAQFAVWTHWIFSNASKFDWVYPWLSQLFDWAPSQISALDWAQSLQVYYKDLVWTIPLTGPVKYVVTAVIYLTGPLHYLTGAVNVDLTAPVIWHLRPYLFLPRVAILTSVLAIILVLFPIKSKPIVVKSTTTNTAGKTTTSATRTTRLLPHPSLTSLSHLAVHLWTLHGLSLGPLGAPALLATMVQGLAVTIAVTQLLSVYSYKDHSQSNSQKYDQKVGQGQGQQHTQESSQPLLLMRSWVLHLALMARWLFFASGHKCDFGALQLSSGFIGADTFHFVYAGSLLALNTFGGEICMMVTVLAVVKGQGLGQELAQERKREEEHKGIQDNALVRGKHGNDLTGSVKSDLTGSALDLTGNALAHWCGYRLWLLAATAGCCCLHRRHLMVWAVFAPKFAFEASFWLVTGVVGVILSWGFGRKL